MNVFSGIPVVIVQHASVLQEHGGPPPNRDLPVADTLLTCLRLPLPARKQALNSKPQVDDVVGELTF